MQNIFCFICQTKRQCVQRSEPVQGLWFVVLLFIFTEPSALNNIKDNVKCTKMLRQLDPLAAYTTEWRDQPQRNDNAVMRQAHKSLSSVRVHESIAQGYVYFSPAQYFMSEWTET